MHQKHCFHPSILRECDIRGVFGRTLGPADAIALGEALVAFIRHAQHITNPNIAVARDGRLSSPELETHLLAAIRAAGGVPLSLGCGPSPLLYFAAHTLPIDAAIMITGSHNPKNHNGFKMMVGREMVHGPMIRQLADLAAIPPDQAMAEVPVAAAPPRSIDLSSAYIERLTSGLADAKIGQLSIGWDAGHGATGEILQRLVRQLPGCHLLLNAEIDGNFPAHHPDPVEPANLRQLQRLVAEQGLDLGIAFDGDGDRIGAVDAGGRIIWADQLLAILARDVLAAHPGATVIADVKASQSLFDEITRLGGLPLMWKTGHSLIKTKMIATRAKLAGEMSGHIFFADEYYGYDDALYAAMRLVRVISCSGLSLAALVDQLPRVINTPEIRLPCDESEKFAVVQRVAAALQRDGAMVDTTDGLRVCHDNGWWLLRASNTQAALVVRAEAQSTGQLALLLDDLRRYLAQEAILLDAIAA